MKASLPVLSLAILLFAGQAIAAPSRVSVAYAAPPRELLKPAPEVPEYGNEEHEGREGEETPDYSHAPDYDSEDGAESHPDCGDMSFQEMKSAYRKYTIKRLLAGGRRHGKCNVSNVQIRKNWSRMSKFQRRRYTSAVRCLYNLPSQSDPRQVPGARNRLDDFVATHLILTNNVHFNGYIFAWHRQFLHLYDQELRRECGYRGPTPYWDWTEDHEDPRKSPVFDGSPYSMGGNGEAIPHGNTTVEVFGITLKLPAGTGGGCLKQGPFSDLIVNLGKNPTIAPAEEVAAQDAVSTTSTSGSSTVNVDPSTAASGWGAAVPAGLERRQDEIPADIQEALQYNPRCLTRDLNLGWSALTTGEAVLRLLRCPNIQCLEQRMDGWEPDVTEEVRQSNQLHAGGHFTVGGLNNDPYASPGDPVFFLHHANVDRIWSIWQAMDPAERLYQVGGTKTPFNNPPSEAVQATDLLKFGILGPDLSMHDIADPLDERYCYIYL